MKILAKDSLIAVEGIQVHAYHGVYKNEKTEGNIYIVDLYLNIDLEPSSLSDELSDTLDYYQAYKLVLDIMAEPVHLLEHLSRKIAQGLLDSFSELKSGQVRVSKVQPHAMEACAQTYVELKFER